MRLPQRLWPRADHINHGAERPDQATVIQAGGSDALTGTERSSGLADPVAVGIVGREVSLLPTNPAIDIDRYELRDASSDERGTKRATLHVEYVPYS